MCGLLKRQGSDDSLSSSSSTAAPLDSFPLLDLPLELILHVIRQTEDYRHFNDSFPSGANDDLIHLSATSKLFNSLCRPLVWTSVNYKPPKGPRSKAYQQRRNLQELVAIFTACTAVGTDRDGDVVEARGIPPIKALYISAPRRARGDRTEDIDEELRALVDILSLMGAPGAGGNLKVLWLIGLMLEAQIGQDLLAAIGDNTHSLRAVRFNQCHFDFPHQTLARVVRGLPKFEKLTTLQVMHGSKGLLDFTRIAPNLQSLLLWPENRRMGSLINAVTSLLPSLRFLSIDAVREASSFATIASEIKKFISEGTSIPLEEIFLEGPQAARDRNHLIQALSLTTFPLKRLALYHLRTTKPSLLFDIVSALPELEGLTLVSGDTQEPVNWEAPLEEYITQLKKLRKLEFLAFDRATPMPLPTLENPITPTRFELEYQALQRIGAGCSPTLKNAVAITLDVSQGSAGFFATYGREGTSRTISVKQKTVQDFLVSFDRWVVLPDGL